MAEGLVCVPEHQGEFPEQHNSLAAGAQGCCLLWMWIEVICSHTVPTLQNLLVSSPLVVRMNWTANEGGHGLVVGLFHYGFPYQSFAADLTLMLEQGSQPWSFLAPSSQSFS